MDVEEISRRHLAAGTPDDEIVRLLAEDVLTVKHNRITPAYARAFARAVLAEAKNSTGLSGDLFVYEPSGSTMGEFGVGSRGSGDFFAHRQLARIIGRTNAAVGVDEMDDAGAVRAEGDYIIATVDGMHSRLSDFPFLAGFHVTRATLRDVYVMGAKPVALLSDIHVADDGDVAKIFDYTAGVSAVGEAMGVPLVTGSTLRIGGDMVLGSRMTGCVGAVGVARHLTARKQIAPGDVLLMTEGAGGGTIATAAIYSGFPEVVDATINLHFLKACEALLADSVLPAIHAMTDVTNGGLRGDAYEMAETAGCRIVVVEDELRTLVQPEVLAMLDALEIDYLGVSLDALLVVAPPEVAPEIRRVVESAGVAMREVGYVETGKPESVLSVGGEIRDFSPRFRESAYTPVKKVVDENKRDFEEMKAGVRRAADAALAKKLRILSRLRSS
ncbi:MULTISPECIES: AIR synthase-related protein [unclassified Methanoculleus]|jgi:hydrogenase expression/formation protein|uniref:AIR synthase-related protein n=1 Tax=unclassified Methanoculleus TaxID=2619537 RepID=UPI0025F309F4|nr:AIR synthase-related protein [Methanoculleus sp. UBA377]